MFQVPSGAYGDEEFACLGEVEGLVVDWRGGGRRKFRMMARVFVEHDDDDDDDEKAAQAGRATR